MIIISVLAFSALLAGRFQNFNIPPKMETVCSGRQSYPTSLRLFTPRFLHEEEINM